jgi:hypothetical protein
MTSRRTGLNPVGCLAFKKIFLFQFQFVTIGRKNVGLRYKWRNFLFKLFQDPQKGFIRNWAVNSLLLPIRYKLMKKSKVELKTLRKNILTPDIIAMPGCWVKQKTGIVLLMMENLTILRETPFLVR